MHLLPGFVFTQSSMAWGRSSCWTQPSVILAGTVYELSSCAIWGHDKTIGIYRLLRWGSSNAADLIAAEGLRAHAQLAIITGEGASDETGSPSLLPSDLSRQGSFAVNGDEVQQPALCTASR